VAQGLYQETTVFQEVEIQFLILSRQQAVVDQDIITQKKMVEVAESNLVPATLLQLLLLKVTMVDHKFNLAVAELAEMDKIVLQVAELAELEEIVLYQVLQ
jgi:hypothetical protein|tara:strand:+ start:212 stop:514 length:303 start_codon:yes stop_codon:yes gene_type:complete